MNQHAADNPTASRWLDPQVVSSIESLEFLATQVVEGFITGLHSSPYRGYNQEFAEHRQYQPGDELRYLDWRLFARTDRFYVKQFEADTNLRATLILDASESMDFSGEDVPRAEGSARGHRSGLTKLDYAKRLAACLSHLLLKQRDAAGLAIFDETLRDYIPARASSNHLRNLMQALDSAVPKGATSIASILNEVASRLARRGVVILISDLIDEPDRVLESLSHLRSRRHEVIVFHMLDRQEIDLDYRGNIRFLNPEGSDTIDSDPVALRESYRKEFTAVVEKYRQGCLEHRIGYERVVTDTPLEKVLPSFLVRRGAMGVRA
ncbi:MAG: DUF58 domain-containing protein [Candidatus Omnitrophica bacterium]|nr:DUF58 domain-containing protein [Candidatus Omnitrophota bacterium]